MFDSDVSTRRGRLAAWADSLLVDHCFFRVLWRNFHTIDPGRLYRSNHPMPWQLAQATQRYGLKAIINLRGERPGCGTDRLARDAARQMGLMQFDVKLESRGAPKPERVHQLLEIYRTLPGPTLIHCKSGADRAGLAAGLYVLQNGGDSRAALQQLNLRYLHFSRSNTGILDAFFLRYQREAEGRIPFRQWLDTEYDPAKLRSDFHADGLSAFLVDRILHRE